MDILASHMEGDCARSDDRSERLLAHHRSEGRSPAGDGSPGRGSWEIILAKKAKPGDAVMTGILVTKFKMGQIDVEDLEQMAADATRAERCSAAKKVLDAVRDAPDYLHSKPLPAVLSTTRTIKGQV
jgi:hypothetical protein